MTAPALQVRGISKSFGAVRVIDDVSFTVPERAVTAIIGPNGAGKTTLFNTVTNLYPIDRGEILFGGVSLRGRNATQIARLGLVRTFQTARILPGMTVLENVLAGAHMNVRAGPLLQALWLPGSRREERALTRAAEELLEHVGLLRFRDDSAVELPMGSQKMLEVVRALMTRPKLLMLDEPAAGLNDSETSDLAHLLRAVADNGITIVVVEHNMALVMGVADQVICLDAGRLVTAGTPREVQRHPRVIEAYMGQDQHQDPVLAHA